MCRQHITFDPARAGGTTAWNKNVEQVSAPSNESNYKLSVSFNNA